MCVCVWGVAKQSSLTGKSPTSLLAGKLWGLGWRELEGPKVVCLLTSNNRKDFGGVTKVNTYCGFMVVVVCNLIFKDIFVVLQDSAQLVKKKM